MDFGFSIAAEQNEVSATCVKTYRIKSMNDAQDRDSVLIESIEAESGSIDALDTSFCGCVPSGIGSHSVFRHHLLLANGGAAYSITC